MALNDNATLIVDSANYFVAPAGTVLPANFASIAALWENIGHTDLDEVIGFSSEGGESEVKGTLQNRKLRTKRSTQTDKMRINLQQFDQAGLKLFYGSNSEVNATTGAVRKPDSPEPTRKAFLAVFYDGANALYDYCPLVEIIGGDAMELADAEEFASLPLDLTPLNYLTNKWARETSPVFVLADGPDGP